VPSPALDRVPSREIAVNDSHSSGGGRLRSSRARRFALDVPLRYRARGEKQWHDAQTENISRSGVLFRTQGVLDIATEVEMTFVLPGLEEAPAIVCRGRVVRTVLPGGIVRWPGIAVTISRFRFHRRRPAA